MSSTTRIMALFTTVFTTLLTYALALSIPVPTPAEPQANTNGLPGAVYRCFVDHFDDFHYVHGTDCEWVPPDEAKKCYHGFLGSIGPDPGGYCQTYADWFCSEDQMMEYERSLFDLC
ncbi:hypothetical protein GRF29_112g1208338 [Pseudopithomyces chartarum]|uniref:Uncharacterized protein n=1 Tax=Pseudopithomyces chartarum TaxID=1892770 RepID=A0AAN6LS28_9PLEO|nr:hypothetical protein GRF29_112g1208338 [Pseudopithomyces chartarum]